MDKFDYMSISSDTPVDFSTYYNSHTIQWYVLTPYKNEFGRYCHASSDSCRESITGDYAKHLTGGTSPMMALSYIHKDVARRDRVQVCLAGLAMVNMFEEYLGWEERTKLIPARQNNDDATMYLIDAAPKWMTASQTMSVLMLFLRGGYRLMEAGLKCPCCMKDVGVGLAGTGSGDLQFMLKYADLFVPLLWNIDKIWKGRTVKQNFTVKTIEKQNGGGNNYNVYSIGSEGCNVFFGGTAKDLEVQKRFQALV